MGCGEKKIDPSIILVQAQHFLARQPQIYQKWSGFGELVLNVFAGKEHTGFWQCKHLVHPSPRPPLGEGCASPFHSKDETCDPEGSNLMSPLDLNHNQKFVDFRKCFVHCEEFQLMQLSLKVWNGKNPTPIKS